MRNSVSFRLWGCSAFLLVCVTAQAQINLSTLDPGQYKSNAVESFEGSQFVPYIGVPNANPIGLNIWNGQGTMTFAQTSATNQHANTQFQIYNTTNAPWYLSNTAIAGVYNDGGTQGLGIQAAADDVATTTIALNYTKATFFGGYFNEAYVPGATGSTDANGNPVAAGVINFAFFNGANEVAIGSLTTSSGDVTNGALIGAGFDLTAAGGFTSVSISGEAVAMDSLRFATQTAPVPEPASFAVLGIGLLALRRRKRS